MIVKLLNAVLILAVLISASVLYSLEQNKRSVARNMAKVDARIIEEKETLKLLAAEWSSLTRPDRIRELAARFTQLEPPTAAQYAQADQLSLRLPAHPFVKLEPEGVDSIGKALQGMTP